MESIILLHGALGAAYQFNHITTELSKDYKVYTFDFIGHGPRELSTPFSIVNFSDDLEQFIVAKKIANPTVFGYSMGGYVALHLASENDRILKKVITYGTKVLWNKAIASQETKLLIPEKIEEKVPKFAQYLASLHGESKWKDVVNHTAQLMINLGNNNSIETFSKRINVEVEIGISNTDEMVTLAESKHIASYLRNGTLKIHNNLPHPIQKINQETLLKIIKEGINNTQT